MKEVEAQNHQGRKIRFKIVEKGDYVQYVGLEV